MQAVQQPEVAHTVISSGVDWITCTNEGGLTGRYSDEFAEREFIRRADNGERTKPASRLGYVGYEVDGFFYGSRNHGRLMIASGVRAQDLFRPLANLSDNISRLDVQVTLWTHGEQPHLGRQAYACLRHNPPARVRVRNLQLIDGHPQGETCNVGKRASDQYGRIYDKASEALLGQPRTIWRYEVETKRGVARAWSSALCSDRAAPALARALVWEWFTARGLQPPFSSDEASNAFDLRLARRKSDALTWFRDTLSKTVKREVEQHGLATVLDALGLLSLIGSNHQKEV